MAYRAGLLQFNPILGENEINRKRVESLLNNAGDADLYLLPELSNSGYNFRSVREAENTSEKVENSPFIDTLSNIAAKKGCFIVAGINENDNGRLYNTSVLTGPEGVVGKYRKIHLFVNEKDFFEPGDLGVPVFNAGEIKLGMLICFDYLFADAWRIMAVKGADVICHPSNLITQNAYRTLPGHALMNRIFILTANRFGTEDDLTFCGRSVALKPDGSVLFEAGREEEGVFIVDIDPDEARNKMVTQRNHAFNDRRPDQYR
jgi:predicted amidohydrolase